MNNDCSLLAALFNQLQIGSCAPGALSVGSSFVQVCCSQALCLVESIPRIDDSILVCIIAKHTVQHFYRAIFLPHRSTRCYLRTTIVSLGTNTTSAG